MTSTITKSYSLHSEISLTTFGTNGIDFQFDQYLKQEAIKYNEQVTKK